MQTIINAEYRKVDADEFGWKVFTHDRRPPIWGGEPAWDGRFPCLLPKAELDRSSDSCGAGWNFTRDISTALCIAGMWPNGRPSVVVRVRPIGEWLERSDKCRAESLRLIRYATEPEICKAIRKLSDGWFGEHATRMAAEQLNWRKALARPNHDETQALAALKAALAARELDWTIKRFDSAWAARDAWDSWDARDAWDSWDARAAWDSWDARAAWAAWDARAARDAWAALSVCYAALVGWINYDPMRLTTGIRDAYYNGLEIALPTGPNELGYAMTE